jgi:hypothetical protein
MAEQPGYRPESPVPHEPPIGDGQAGTEEAAVPLENITGLPKESQLEQAAESSQTKGQRSSRPAHERARRFGEYRREARVYKDIYQKHREALEALDPLAQLKPTEYDRLIELGYIDKDYAEALKKLDDSITTLESLPAPTPQQEQALSNNVSLRAKTHEQLASLINTQRAESAKSKEDLLASLPAREEDHYRRIHGLATKLLESPEVEEELKKQFEIANEQHRQDVAREIEKPLAIAESLHRGLAERHQQTSQRLDQVVGSTNVLEKLLRAQEQPDSQASRDLYRDTYHKIADAIIVGSGDRQITSPSQLVPWETNPSRGEIDYGNNWHMLHQERILDALKNSTGLGNQGIQERGERVTKGVEQLAAEREALHRLYGRKWVKESGQAGKKEVRLGRFWAEFELRKKLDADRQKAAGLITNPESQKLLEINRGRGFVVAEAQKSGAPKITMVGGDADPSLAGKDMGALSDRYDWLRKRIVSQFVKRKARD